MATRRPTFNDDLVVREGGVSSRQQAFHINSAFIQEANTGGGPFKLEVLAVWNSAWGAPEGISTGVATGRTASAKMHGCQAYHGMRRYPVWSPHIGLGQDVQALRVLYGLAKSLFWEGKEAANFEGLQM